MKVTALAPGKVFLLGEYAVLEGAPALVVAVDRFARTSIRPTDRDHFLIDVPALDIFELPVTLHRHEEVQFLREKDVVISKHLRFIISALETANSILRAQSRNFIPGSISLEIDGFFSQPAMMKLGIGASAATTVAMLAGLLRFNAAGPPDRFELLQNALKSHHSAQGNLGSGADIAASVFGGVIRFEKPAKNISSPVRVQQLAMPPDLNIQCIWTGKSASTRKLIQKVNGFKAAYPLDYRGLLGRLAQLSADGCSAFQRKDIKSFLTIVRRYHQQLVILGQSSRAPIITAEHQQLAEIVRRAGGAYKPSGAGGGDLGLAFSHCTSVMQNISAEINGFGFQIMNLKTGAPGVQIKPRQNELNDRFSTT